MIGTTGAIYAMRRACWQPLPDGTILDDLLAPMRAVLAGWRVVFEPRALAFDVTAPTVAAESAARSERSREITRSWRWNRGCSPRC